MNHPVRNSIRVRRRVRLPLAIIALSLFLPVQASASEAVTNRFDLFVPVSLSVLEVSSAVGIVPSPLVVCAAMHSDQIAQAMQEVVR